MCRAIKGAASLTGMWANMSMGRQGRGGVNVRKMAAILRAWPIKSKFYAIASCGLCATTKQKQKQRTEPRRVGKFPERRENTMGHKYQLKVPLGIDNKLALGKYPLRMLSVM